MSLASSPILKTRWDGLSSIMVVGVGLSAGTESAHPPVSFELRFTNYELLLVRDVCKVASVRLWYKL